MQNIDWMNVTIVGLAIAIFVGGMLMMFTGIWTGKER
jgi:succinate-acetate transporter protein